MLLLSDLDDEIKFEHKLNVPELKWTFLFWSKLQEENYNLKLSIKLFKNGKTKIMDICNIIFRMFFLLIDPTLDVGILTADKVQL